jgi:hypothetical protein
MVGMMDQNMGRNPDSGHPATCPAQASNKGDLKVGSLVLVCDQGREGVDPA